MRIIAGRFRRRKLLANPGLTTRPLTDLAKEILFERLQSEVEGKRVADIFAGTGTIGLEALSRGASGVVFIEKDRRAFELLKKNVAALGVEGETLCWNVDVLRCSFRPKNVPHLVPFEAIFFDPPYRMMEGLKEGAPLYLALQRLAREEVSAPAAQLMVRTSAGAEFAMPPCWRMSRLIKLRSMQAHVFEKCDAEQAG